MKKEVVDAALKAEDILTFERIVLGAGYSEDRQSRKKWPKELQDKYDELTEGMNDFNCIPDYF